MAGSKRKDYELRKKGTCQTKTKEIRPCHKKITTNVDNSFGNETMEGTHALLTLNFLHEIQMPWIQVQRYERPQLRQKSKSTDKKDDALKA